MGEPPRLAQVPSQRDEGNKQAEAKSTKEKPERKTQRDRGRYMEFLFESVYQIITWIGIALSIMFIGLFYAQQNWRGALWSGCVLACLAVVMLCLLAQRSFPVFQLHSGRGMLPATQDDVAEIKRQLDELYASLKPPEIQVTEKNPGLSLQAVLRFHVLSEKRRKYLFDFGKLDKGRVSIYFDPDNIFTLAFLDANGEAHAVRIPSGSVGIPLEEFIYLSCEVGVSGNATSLRVLVNGHQVGTLDLPFRVDPGTLDPTGGVVGADLNGKNGARFDVAEIALYSVTLTTSEIASLLQYFSRKPNVKFVQFDGTQWMRNEGTGKGLRQDIPEAKPRFRNLEARISN